MEDLLADYERPFSDGESLVCLDEKSVTQLDSNTSCGKKHPRLPEAKKASAREAFTPEQKQLIEVLRASGQLLETDDEDATVPSGTHMLLVNSGQEPKLIRISTATN
jgi:hypothetical protein